MAARGRVSLFVVAREALKRMKGEEPDIESGRRERVTGEIGPTAVD